VAARRRAHAVRRLQRRIGAGFPTDLGIKVAREAFARSGVSPQDVGAVITGSMAQASFDTYCLPRHIGLYSGVPIEVPAHMVQRVCGTGLEVLVQAADVVTHKAIGLTLCVGAESMSRNPIASYSMRGFRMGSVDFKDFLWEALRDPAADVTMGDTAENLARTYQITRPESTPTPRAASNARSRHRNRASLREIAPVKSETFEREGFQPRKLKLNGVDELGADTHVRPSPLETLAAIRPAFGGVQTGAFLRHRRRGGGGARRLLRLREEEAALARILAGATVGVRPDIMGIGPVPAIKAVLERAGLKLSDIDRFEINEASARRSWRARANSASTKPSSTSTAAPSPSSSVGRNRRAARPHARARAQARAAALRHRVGCIGGGQGIALLIENVPSTRNH